MAVYKPTFKDKKTGIIRHSNLWWYDFIFAGKRIRECSKTTRLILAREVEKNRRLELERAYAGLPSEPAVRRIYSVADLVKAYRAGYSVNHREKSVSWVKERTAHVVRLVGNLLLPDVTEARVRQYMQQRLEEGSGNRTVNMELLCLSRAIGKTWRELWPKVKRLEERTNIGRALSSEEESAILTAATRNKSPLIHPFIRVALLTAMRHDEIRKLRWQQIDLESRIIRVGKAKTRAGAGREIPMNQDLFATLSMHASWYAKRFGPSQPEWYIFPQCNRARPIDPMKPITTVKTAWETVREAARVACRFHDLRHTTLTKMAEAGVPESTMLALAGHMSRAMLERYSHIRMKAKRAAVEMISLADSAAVTNGIPTVATKVAHTSKSARLV